MACTITSNDQPPLLLVLVLAILLIAVLALAAGWAYCMVVSPFTGFDCSNPFNYFWHGLAIIILLMLLGFYVRSEIEVKK